MSGSSKALAIALAGVLLAGGAGAAWAAGQIRGRTGQEQPSTQPQFVPGPAEVVGTVAIENEPVVHAQQLGPWSVTLAEPPVVASAPPAFVHAGRTYDIRWAADLQPERYGVLAVLEGGWAQARRMQAGEPGPRLWINVGRAIAVEEIAGTP